MGLFKRDDRPHKTFAELKAENEAKRQAKAEQRHAEGKTTFAERTAARAAELDAERAELKEHVHLRKIAADPTRTDDERQQARAALTEAIGAERADKTIRAEADLMRHGWRR